MPLKFTTKQKRDELAERLASLATDMRRSWDQGSDGRIIATEEVIGDIQTAACVVALSEIEAACGCMFDTDCDPKTCPHGMSARERCSTCNGY